MIAELDMAEAGAEPTLKRGYTWGLDLSGSMAGAGGIGGLLEIRDFSPPSAGTAGTYLTVYDGNGNLTGLVSASSKSLVAEYEYDPFGGLLRETGRQIAMEQPFRFATKTYDRETELCNFGFRHYSPSLGRFLNRDPIEERGGWALFSGLNYGVVNPFYGNSTLGAGNFLAEYGSRQDAGLKNTSLAHSTETVGTGQPKDSTAKWERDINSKYYSANANATGHVGQGGSSGVEWHTFSTNVASPDPWNRDANLYIYSGNDPINNCDPLGLFGFGDFVDYSAAALSGAGQGLYSSTIGATVSAYKDGAAQMANGFQSIADGNTVLGVLQVVASVGSAVQVASDIADGPGSATAMLKNVSELAGRKVAANIGESAASKVADKVADSAAAAKGSKHHGNDRRNTNPQHRYEIVQNSSGDVVKTGISGKPLNKNGTSGRANEQVNKLNAAEGEGTYSARVVETNLPGRQAGLDAEQAATTQLDAAGNSLRLQKRPKP